jgi:hypothetical protein
MARPAERENWAFNAVAWGSLIGLTFLIRRIVVLLIPCFLGFGFLGWSPARLDLAADAQAGLGLVIIPIDALVPTAIGEVMGLVVDCLSVRSGMP